MHELQFCHLTLRGLNLDTFFKMKKCSFTNARNVEVKGKIAIK